VFVVAGGQAAPVLESVEGSFDDVAVLVVLGVEADRSAAAGAPVLVVADLVGGLADDSVMPRDRRCARWALAE
jgi:hypothetical protein